MAREPIREIPVYDPYESYQIRSHNKKYTGDANGVRFVDGLGVVNGLPLDSDESEEQERREQLMWFWNANPLLKKVAVDPTEPDGEQEWRTYTAYLIEAYDPNTRQRPKAKNQPITVREMAGAKGGA